MKRINQLKSSRVVLSIWLALSILYGQSAFAQDLPTGEDSTFVGEMNEGSESDRTGLVESKLSLMVTKVSDITKLRDQVKLEERDIKKLNCVNERLSAMKGFLRVGEDAQRGYSAASGPKEKEHYFRLIVIGSGKVDSLHDEAMICVGDIQVTPQTTKRLVEVDEDIKHFDTTKSLVPKDVFLSPGTVDLSPPYIAAEASPVE